MLSRKRTFLSLTVMSASILAAAMIADAGHNTAGFARISDSKSALQQASHETQCGLAGCQVAPAGCTSSAATGSSACCSSANGCPESCCPNADCNGSSCHTTACCNGHGGQDDARNNNHCGCCLMGCYGLVYAVNPDYFDQRDGQLFSAPGYGSPITIPLAPNVHHEFNYGWGIPSSRITHISHRAPYTVYRPLDR